MTELSGKASITTDMFNNSLRLDFERKFELFAEFGFGHVHWCDDWDNGAMYSKADFNKYDQLIRSHGLKCIDVHGSESNVVQIAADADDVLEQYVGLLRNRIEFCSAVGGDTVVVHMPTAETGSDSLAWKLERSGRVFDTVRPLCEDLGIALAVENSFPSDFEMIEWFLERYPPEFVGLCLDSGHANMTGDLSRLMGLGDRLVALHLHDNKGISDDHQPPFWGTIDWRDLVLWIDGCGYKKPLNFEVIHNPRFFEGSPEEFLEYTVKAIQKVIALTDSL